VRTRVHLLAKELWIETKVLIAQLDNLGMKGRKAQSSLADNEVTRVRAALATQEKYQVHVGEEVVVDRVIKADEENRREIQARETVVERRVRANVVRRRTSPVEAISRGAPDQIFTDPAVRVFQEQTGHERNRIRVNGPLGHADFHPVVATIDDAISKLGHEDLVLDFSECSAAFAGPMLALCAQVADLRARGVRTELVLPQNEKLATLFKNTNWAYFLDPVRQKQSSFRGHTQSL